MTSAPSRDPTMDHEARRPGTPVRIDQREAIFVRWLRRSVPLG
jgi:hypothetical protein